MLRILNYRASGSENSGSYSPCGALSTKELKWLYTPRHALGQLILPSYIITTLKYDGRKPVTAEFAARRECCASKTLVTALSKHPRGIEYLHHFKL